MRYYICSGLNPNTETIIKRHWSKFLIRLFSFMIHLILGSRILIFKIRGKKLINPIQSNIAISKDVFENRSLTDLTTSLVAICVFVLSMLPANLVNEMDPVETSKFPKYLFVYFVHLVAPILMAGFTILIYFIRNEHFRKTLILEVRDLFERHFKFS